MQPGMYTADYTQPHLQNTHPHPNKPTYLEDPMEKFRQVGQYFIWGSKVVSRSSFADDLKTRENPKAP